MVCLFLLHRKLRLCFSFSPSGLEPSIESRTIFVLDPWQVASVTQFVVSVTGMIDDSCWEILEKAMATHSSTLAWKIPWKEEPGRLLSMGSHRVRHDWSNLAAAAAAGKSYWGLLTIRRVMKHWVPEGFWAGSTWAGPHIGGGGAILRPCLGIKCSWLLRTIQICFVIFLDFLVFIETCVGKKWL